MESSNQERKLVLPVINLNKLAPGFKLSQTHSFNASVGMSMSGGRSGLDSSPVMLPADISSEVGRSCRNQSEGPSRKTEEFKNVSSTHITPNKLRRNYVEVETIYRTQQQPTSNPQRPPSEKRKNKPQYIRKKPKKPQNSQRTPMYKPVSMTGQYNQPRRMSRSKTPERASTHVSSPTGSRSHASRELIPFVEPVGRNPNEQLANLALEYSKNEGMPIPLEKLDQKYMYQRKRNPEEDNSGCVMFSKQGFFEIPKEKGKQSRFISQKAYAKEGMNYEMFSKLDFYKNWYPRKMLCGWRKVTSVSHFERHRDKLALKWWFAKPILAKHTPTVQSCMNHLQELLGLDCKEGGHYGKRHTDFPSRQKVIRANAVSKFENQTKILHQMLEGETEEVTTFMKKRDDEVLDRQIREIVDNKRSDDIGVARKPRGVAKLFQETEDAKRIYTKLHHSFVLLTKTMYQEAVIHLLQKNLRRLVQVICESGPTKKPRFEVIMKVDEDVIVEPHLTDFKTIIFDAVKLFRKELLSSNCIAKFNEYTMELQGKSTTTGYTNLDVFIRKYLKTNAEICADKEKMATQLTYDIDEADKFRISFKHLKEIKQNGNQWVQDINDRRLDIIQFYKENYQTVKDYSEKIDQIPAHNTKKGIIDIETITVRTELLEIPKVVQSCLKDQVLDVLIVDSSELKQELFRHVQALLERATNLANYVQQLKSIYNLRKEKVFEFTKRLDFIDECLILCRNYGIRVPAPSIIAIEEIKQELDSVEEKIRSSEDYYTEKKQYFDELMRNATNTLTRKIRKFEQKYKARYLNEPDRSEKPADTLRELEKRNEAIATIKKRVDLYDEYDRAIFQIEHSEEEAYEPSVGQAECKKCFDNVYNLHCDTIKLWKLVGYWQKCRETWYQTKFVDLQIPKIKKRCARLKENLANNAYEGDSFIYDAAMIIKQFLNQIKEVHEILEVIADLKDLDLKPRHWEAIVKIIRKPHFLMVPFTLYDLIEAQIQKFAAKIKTVIDDALVESRQEEILIRIKDEWENTELDTMPFRNRLDTFILINTEKIEYLIEEHRATIESLEFSQHAEHIMGEIEDWKAKLNLMSEILELWVSTQKSWLYLEPIFSNSRDSLPQEFDVFQEIQNNFRRVMWSAKQNPKATYNLLQHQRIELFEELMGAISSVRKNIHEFLESRRLSFPRFFFLCDNQLLEFIAGANSQGVYDKHISAIFPAVSQLYIKRIETGKSTVGSDDDQDQAPFNIFSPAGNELMRPFEFSDQEEESKSPDLDPEAPDSPDRDYNIVEKQRRLKEKYDGLTADFNPAHPYEILGMLGHNLELLLFEKSVSIMESPEIWMADVEAGMKETLGKMITMAVTAFPKLSLDEWILDFPQQVIFTSIYLILTHEIEELLEELNQPVIMPSINEENKEEGEEPQEAPEQTVEQTEEPIPQQYEEHFSKVFFGSGAQTASMDQSRVKLMRILQAKSFKGLYLRLQFWVNQIVKSLSSDTENRLTNVNVMALESIVNLLIYQRDIIGEMIAKKITSSEDFEWVKHMRVSWKQNDNYAKIECGALSLIQGNEYLGTQQRLLCNPITTRYFMFISSALREHSSVLFKTNRSHDFASDIFDEFSSMCGICCKKFYIQEATEMSSLMQFLNGAALANMWSIFEHVDKLSTTQLQVIAKEIQMVQQQFLIAEMVEDDDDTQSADTESMQQASNASNAGSSVGGRRQSRENVQESVDGPADTRIERSNVNTYSATSDYVTDSNWKMGRAKVQSKLNMNLFVVFASLSQSYNEYKDTGLLKTLQSSFRAMELVKPDFTLLLTCLLIKKEFHFFRPLCRNLTNFLTGLSEVNSDFYFNSRDMHSVVYLARSLYKEYVQDQKLAEKHALAKATKVYFYYRLVTILENKMSKEDITSMLDEIIVESFELKSPNYPLHTQLWFQMDTHMPSLKLHHQDWQIKQALQLWELLRLNRAVAIIGEPCSGKSTLLKLLIQALHMAQQIVVQKFTVNPNIFTLREFFGDQENELSQGILPKLIADNSMTDAFRWMVLDALEIKPWWTEMLVPILDQTPIISSIEKSITAEDFFDNLHSRLDSKENFITLPNSMHLHLPKDFSIIIETTDISAISPSVMTRIGTIYVSDEDLSWESMLVRHSLNITEKFATFGITGYLVKDKIKERYKDILVNCDSMFSNNPNWNMRTLTSTFFRLIENIIEKEIIPGYDHVAQDCGITEETSAAQLLEIIQYGNFEKLHEIQDLVDVAILISLVWSYGAVLTSEEKAKMNTLIHDSRDIGDVKFLYPLDSNVFDWYFEFNMQCFKPMVKANVCIYSNMPVLIGGSLVAPDISHFQVKHAFNFSLIKNSRDEEREIKHDLAHFRLIGPQGSGKTSIINWMLSNEAVIPVEVAINGFNSISQIQELVDDHFNLKTSEEAVPHNQEKQVVLIIDDLHLDQQGVGEFITSWQVSGGFYCKPDLNFKVIPDINIISTSNAHIPGNSQTHVFLIDTIDSDLFKQILNNYVYSKQFTEVKLMHRYAGLMSSILNTLKKRFNLSTTRLTNCLMSMIQFTQDIDAFYEKGEDEGAVSEMFAFELACSFGREVWQKSLEIVNTKFNSHNINLNLFGDYALDSQRRYDIEVPYVKVNQDDELIGKIDRRCKGYRCKESFYPLQIGPSTNEANQITSCVMHQGKLHEIWALCRVISGKGRHIVLRTQQAFELVQIACILKKAQLFEPRASKLGAFEQFQSSFEESMVEVLERVHNDEDAKSLRRVFMVRTSHVWCEKVFDYLYSYISHDCTNILSKNIKTKITALEIEHLKIKAPEMLRGADPLSIALKKINEHLTLILLIDKPSSMSYFSQRYPDLLNRCELLEDAGSTNEDDIKDLVWKFLKYRRFQDRTAVSPVLCEIWFYLSQAFQKKEVENLDRSVQINPEEYLTIGRLFKFLEFYINLCHKLTDNIVTKREKLREQIEKAESLSQLHVNFEKSKKDLQAFSSDKQSNIDHFIEQIDKIRKNQAEKAVHIKNKEEANAKLKNEFDILERDNSEAMAGREQRIIECIDRFDNEVQASTLTYILQNHSYHLNDSYRVLEALALVITGNEGLINHLSDIIAEIANKDNCKKKMIAKKEVMMSTLISIKVQECVQSVEVKRLQPALAIIFYFLEAMLQRLKAIKLLGPQFLRMEEIRNQIDSNNSQIQYAHTSVMEQEADLQKLVKSKDRASAALGNRQEEIQDTETTHNRTDQLMNAVAQLTAKLTKKSESLDERLENLRGDCMILAANVVFLGPFASPKRLRLRAALARLVENNEIELNTEWSRVNEFSHLKIFRRTLKESGFDKLDYHINFVMSDITLYESAFSYLFAPSCLVVLDELGEIKKFYRDSITEHRALQLTAADRPGHKLLKSSLRGKVPVFLEDYNDPQPETDLQGWKLGPGNSLDRYYLHNLSHYAFNIHNPGHKVYNNRKLEVLPKFYTYQTTLIQNRLSFALNQDYIANSTFVYGGDMNKSEAWIEVKMILLKHLIPESYEAMLDQRTKLIESKQKLSYARIKYERDLIMCDESIIKDYEAFKEITTQIALLKTLEQEYNTVAAEYHKSINEHPLIASYSHVLVLMYFSLKQLGRLTTDVTYAWDAFLYIIDTSIAKILRDVANNMKDDAEEDNDFGDQQQKEKINIDEDFFHRVVVPSVWVVIVCGIPQEYTGLYTLILAAHIALKKKEITSEEYAVFSERFLSIEGSLTWPSTLEHYTYTEESWEPVLKELLKEMYETYPDSSPTVEKINRKVTEVEMDPKQVPTIIKRCLDRGRGKILPIFQRIQISMYYPDNLLKRLLRQFIYEQLNSVFEFNEDPIKLHSFIKTASWNVPIAMFSTPGLNIVNTICSLANYYGVGLEVIRTDPGYDNKDEGDDSVELIEKCAFDGSWVLISTSKFISFHKKLFTKLDEIRAAAGFVNTFRLFIDLQGLRHYEIPDSFLHSRCVRFYMSEINTEDIEGYNDVWANLLNEDILKVEHFWGDESSIVYAGDESEI